MNPTPATVTVTREQDRPPIVVGLVSISPASPEDSALIEALKDRGAIVHEPALLVDAVPETLLHKVDVLLVAARVLDANVSGLIRRISGLSSPYLIVLSEADDVVDRIVALELGADDFLHRDSDPREILARAKSLVRRGAQRLNRVGRSMLGQSGKSWVLDDVGRLLRSPLGSVCELSRRDVELIDALVDESREVLSVETYSAEGNCLRVAVSRLRRKFRKVSAEPLPIRNVWGSGYAFDAPLERFPATV